MKLLKLTAISAALLSLAACQQTQQSNQAPSFSELGLTSKTLWQKGNPQANIQFNGLVTRLTALADNPADYREVNDMLYAMRGFSYYGDTDAVSDAQWQQIADSLITLRDDLNTQSAHAPRFIENYAVLLYRFYDAAPMQAELSTLLTGLNPAKVAASDNTQAQYTAWETLRSIGFLSFEARREAVIKEALIDNQADIESAMLALIENDNAWQQDHALWALGYFHQLLDEDAQKALDDKVWQALETNKNNQKTAQWLYSQRYLVNSFRSKSSCDESQKGRCELIELDVALPINHRCSDSLFIRAQNLTQAQLDESCTKLISQETSFHELLDTKRKAVPNDFNDSLRVVIFDSYTGYNQHGQMLFDINTNNGGMYIEGKPSKPGNQATFYSFKQFWVDEFKVWNLNHEYMHYLDGRFNKYDGFGHFPSHLVWWSEGQAELVAQGKNNPVAIKTAKEAKRDEWPTLEEIFATDYSKGSKRIYHWSYLANRYLAENDLAQYRQLAHFLRTDYFDGYAELLDELAEKHQADFNTFVEGLIAEHTAEEKAPKAHVNKLYRYLYRDYLMPTHITLNDQHMHIL